MGSSVHQRVIRRGHGMPQFMPTAIGVMRSTSTPTATPICGNDPADIIGSVGSYLHQSGWKEATPIVAPCARGHRRLESPGRLGSQAYAHTRAVEDARGRIPFQCAGYPCPRVCSRWICRADQSSGSASRNSLRDPSVQPQPQLRDGCKRPCERDRAQARADPASVSSKQRAVVRTSSFRTTTSARRRITASRSQGRATMPTSTLHSPWRRVVAARSRFPRLSA